MKKKLCLRVCEYFRREVEAALAEINYVDLTAEWIRPSCVHPQIQLDPELNLPECSPWSKGKERPWLLSFKDRVVTVDLCFYQFLSPHLVDQAVEQGAFLITPGWLARWQEYTAPWSFDPAGAQQYFAERFSHILLLETLTDEQTQTDLVQFSNFTGLPAKTQPVGLDYCKLQISRVYLEWLLTEIENNQNTLLSVSSEILGHRDLSSLLDDIIARAVRLVGATHGGLFLLNPQENRLFLAASYDLPQELKNVAIGPGEGLSGRVTQDGVPITIEDYSHWDGRVPAYDILPSGRAFGFPLKKGDKVFGAISILDDERTGLFSEKEIHMTNAFADLAAIAIENARLYDALQKELEERKRAQEAERMAQERAEDLRRAMYDLVYDLDLDDLLDRILISLDKVVSYDAASILLLEGDQLNFAAGRGFIDPQPAPGDKYTTDMPLFRKMVQQGEPVFIEDAQAEPQLKLLKSISYTRGWMGAPLIAHGNVLGVLTVHNRKPGIYGRAEAQQVQTFAYQVTLAIHNAQLFESLQTMAVTDPLTGLLNRRSFYELGEAAFKLARRYGHPLSVIMLDIDHFKKVNDTWGHNVGDELLVHLSQCFREHLRTADIM